MAEQQSNARLIAASPRMLAALRGLMGEAERQTAAIDSSVVADRQTAQVSADYFDDLAAERARWQAVIDAVYLATGETP